MNSITPIAFVCCCVLTDFANTEPTPLGRLKEAVVKVESRSLDFNDPVIRSNLPLARLKVRKAELLFDFNKYRGNVESAAAMEIQMGFAALKRIDQKKIAYAGETAGYAWPYDSSTMAFQRATPVKGHWPTYYEYGMDAVNDGSPQPFLVEVPPNYDPKEKWPLLVYLHGYHGRVDMINKWDTTRAVAGDAKELGYLVLAPHGRSETDFLCVGETDVLQALDEFKRYYNVDEDRVYLIGGSMGGYGGLNLAFHYPHLWAGVAAFTASADMMMFGGLTRNRLLPFRRWHFEWDNPIDLCGNVPQLPITGTYGDQDNWVPPSFGKALSEKRTSLGGLYEYSVVPGAGHQVGNDGPVYRQAMEWFKGKTRNRFPKFVRHKTYSLRYDQSFWVRILGIEKWGQPAEVEAQVVGNAIRVKHQNCTGIELTIHDNLIDPARPVNVISNGKQVFDGVMPDDRKVTIQNVATATGLIKRSTLCGPFEDTFNHPFLVVRGTIAKDPADRQRLAGDARWFRHRWEAWTDGWPRMKDDVDVTDEDIKNYGLLLLGRPTENAITARVAPKLPVGFDGNDFVFEEAHYSGSETGLCLVYPNPLNPSRYLAVMAGAQYGLRLPENHPFSQLPDYLIFRAKPVTNADDGSSRVFGHPDQHYVAGFFDSAWKVDPNAMWKAKR